MQLLPRGSPGKLKVGNHREEVAQVAHREDSPITGTWRTNYRGATYVLSDDGRLQPEHHAKNGNPMASISTASIVRGAVEDLLASRHHQQSIDLEYKHNPDTIKTIISDELAALKARRAEHQEQNR